MLQDLFKLVWFIKVNKKNIVFNVIIFFTTFHQFQNYKTELIGITKQAYNINFLF